MHRRLVIALACPLLALAGCGNSRTPAPTVTQPLTPTGFRTLAYPASGVQLQAPSNWAIAAQQSPLVVTVSSGPAIVAVWRHPRSGVIPATPAQLTAARSGLVNAARKRDPTLQLIRANIVTVDGRPAVEISAIEQIAGRQRRVRSLHVFEKNAEVVLEEYSPPAMFHTVDHNVFSPLRRSLRLLPASA